VIIEIDGDYAFESKYFAEGSLEDKVIHMRLAIPAGTGRVDLNFATAEEAEQAFKKLIIDVRRASQENNLF
jgi:hypothetical protein